MPGWPDSACCTASIDSVRIVLMQSSSIECALGAALCFLPKLKSIRVFRVVVVSRVASLPDRCLICVVESDLSGAISIRWAFRDRTWQVAPIPGK